VTVWLGLLNPLLRQFQLSGAELERVTNLARPTERVVAFYNQRGTAEQC